MPAEPRPLLPARDAIGQDLAVGDRIAFIYTGDRPTLVTGTIRLVHRTQLCVESGDLRTLTGQERGGTSADTPTHVRYGTVLRLDNAENAALRKKLNALHEGEEPSPDEHVAQTPAQWIWSWNRATPEQRLDMAARILDASGRAEACIMGAHEGRLEQQQLRLTRLEAERAAALAEHPPTEPDPAEAAQLSHQYRNQAERLTDLLAEVLTHFTETGHPGQPCLRTGWVPTGRVEHWRTLLSANGQEGDA
ncbi:hypothetical protein [Streptomyces sp. C10-9-1]|uniref:hypothetical protein n=1 Tax=Streptomyces sp. C10-9-1 TaxID=1859285 RepID=UPI003F4A3FAF